MHEAAYEFVRSCTSGRRFSRVLEIGSRLVNDPPMPICPLFDCGEYLGLDITEGPGVDVVGDGATWHPEDWRLFDCVVCCEVLEHTPAVSEIIHNACSLLNVRGLLIVTAAGPSREPHSAVDGGQLRPEEYYANVSLADLRSAIPANFEILRAEYLRDSADVCLSALRHG